MLGHELALNNMGENVDVSFRIPAGTYTITVNLANRTCVITRESGGGPVAGKGPGEELRVAPRKIQAGASLRQGGIRKGREEDNFGPHLAQNGRQIGVTEAEGIVPAYGDARPAGGTMPQRREESAHPGGFL